MPLAEAEIEPGSFEQLSFLREPGDDMPQQFGRFRVIVLLKRAQGLLVDGDGVAVGGTVFWFTGCRGSGILFGVALGGGRGLDMAFRGFAVSGGSGWLGHATKGAGNLAKGRFFGQEGRQAVRRLASGSR
jgi:hypothetical protein